MASMEHLDGLRLIASAARQESAHLLAGLVFTGGLPRLLDRLRAALRGDERGQIGHLPGLHREQLIAGLADLQHADRRLAGADQGVGM